MASDSVVLSPEWVNVGRREAPADGAITTGTFVAYTATGVDVAGAGSSARMVAVENIATAQELGYEYSAGENVFCQSVPSGCLLQMQAVDATYTVGQLLAVGAGGKLTDAIDPTTAVAVIPYLAQGATLTGGDGSLIVELL